MLILYSYYRSSAAYRVRIALNLKQLPYELHSVHLIKNGGEQHQPEYLGLNPQGLVPSLQDGAAVITQSLAIINYLEECYPTPALLPAGDPILRAQIYAFALSIACDIHPLNNLRVLNYISGSLQQNDVAKKEWMSHWITRGFSALEKTLEAHDAQHFCFGNKATIADCCLIPQVYNAKRFSIDLTEFPRIVAIYEHCMQLDAFIQASPEQQPDRDPL